MSEPDTFSLDSEGYDAYDAYDACDACDACDGEYSYGNQSTHEENIEIDMDVLPARTTTIKPKLNITKKNNIEKKDTSIALINNKNSNGYITVKEKGKAHPEESNLKIKHQPKKQQQHQKHTSETVDKLEKECNADSKFEFNEETIEFFSKDILSEFNRICVSNSTFTNDTALLCLLIRLKKITEYKCAVKKCKVGKTWLNKPVQLLIHRKNGKIQDLSIENLELICPNCYISLYGLDIFQKVIANTIYTCKICNYPLNNFTNSKKKERFCISCESKIMTSSYFGKKSQYINELKETINDGSTLKKDEFLNTNYYNEVSKFKTLNSRSTSNNKSIKQRSNIDDRPIINLNMTIPDLDELIKENNSK